MKTLVLLIIFISILFSYLIYINLRKKKTNKSAIETKEKILSRTDLSEERRKAIESGECCGQHEVCEKDTLINTTIQAEYYDDEELDQFKNREPESYTEEEIKQFEEVFYTLKEYDVSGWLKSLQIREVNPPSAIREEALFLVQESRKNRNEGKI
ncbi:MAG: phospholipase [Paludibacteraceae bacterium]|nr:phospholipase [Paludibacteraceae bacterium]